MGGGVGAVSRAGPELSALVVESTPANAKLFASLLEAKEGWSVDVASDGHDALALFESRRHAVAILGFQLPPPGPSGIDLCRRLRALSSTVAVLLVAEQRALADILDGLAAGADDCLSRPFEMDELVARTRAVLRRLSAPVAASQAGDAWTGPVALGRHATVDRRTGFVHGPAGRIELSRVEVRILLHFVACGPRALTSEAVAKEVLDRRDAAGKGLVHRYISNIRKKLSAVGVDSAIVRSSFGYRLSTDD